VPWSWSRKLRRLELYPRIRDCCCTGTVAGTHSAFIDVFCKEEENGCGEVGFLALV